MPDRIRYDNLKPAVIKVLKGRNRTESDRFIALGSHYGFDSFFCRPGKQGAHEKGGVEGGIGRFRRRHLVPVPDVSSLSGLNRHIAAGDLLDDARVITGRPHTVAEAFAAELPTLGPLPAEAFDPALVLRSRVDLRARVCVRQCYYSVPARYASRRLTVRLTATTVEVFEGGRLVARHERAVSRYAEVLVLDHYLEFNAIRGGASMRFSRYTSTLIGPTFQMSSQYSAMARSEENLPLRASVENRHARPRVGVLPGAH